MAVDKIVGSWTATGETENIDEYLALIGLSDEMKEKARQSQPRYEIEHDGTTWTFRAIMGDFKRETKFKLGEAFQTSTIDGREVTSTVRQDGNKLVEEQAHPAFNSTITRWVEGDNLMMTITAKSVMCKVKYRKTD
ncbi:sodium/calcium exchanger regulatory protein 1-like isoform X2 [Lineus longissimus]|uniref:sodium/calcium exchanger regulatory protein 1-like isoform X2 n=1 Tax=Lineus longissimus TaxID=88925 RepID=UPI002B4CA46D